MTTGEETLLTIPITTAATEEDLGALTTTNKCIEVQKLEDLLESTRDFSNISNPETIKQICCSHIETWKVMNIKPDEVQVHQILAGLTNQLFQCALPDSSPKGISPSKVLFRIYGTTVGDLYDTDFELEVTKILAANEAAPKLIATFQGGRIEEWVDGNPLLNEKMDNPSILCGLATILSKFHRVDDRAPELKKWFTGKSSLEMNLDRWSKRAYEIFNSVNADANELHDTVCPGGCDPKVLHTESLPRAPTERSIFIRMQSMSESDGQAWRSHMNSIPLGAMLQELTNPDTSKPKTPLSVHHLGGDPQPQTSHKFVEWLLHDIPADYPLVQLHFCHNDVQENNIMVTGTRLRLIDFEYSNYNYLAFDLANWFCEMTMDYCVDHPPLFEHASDPLDFPSDEVIKLFGSIYLSEYTQQRILPSDPRLTLFLVCVKRFALASHLIWAFWSIIRAPQAATNNSFDFIEYAKSRFDAYTKWKEYLLSKSII